MSNRIEDLPILLEALKKNDFELLRKSIEEYGNKLMCIHRRKNEPEVDIFYYLIREYRMKKISDIQFKELAKLAISNDCHLYIHCNENDRTYPEHVLWEEYYSILTDALRSDIIEKNIIITPFIKTLFELAEDAKEIPFETVRKWLCLTEDGSKDVIQYLVNEINISTLINNCHPITGETLLHIACKKNDLQFVEYLLSKSVDVNRPNKEKVLPISYTSNKEITKILLNYGSFINSSEITNE